MVVSVDNVQVPTTTSVSHGLQYDAQEQVIHQINNKLLLL